MILWRRLSFSGIGGPHHRRTCPAGGWPAEAAVSPEGVCPAAGPLFSDCGSSWPEVTAFGRGGISATGPALTGALTLLPFDTHPDVWDAHAEQRNKLAPASMDRAVACFKKALMEAPIFFLPGK